MKMKNSQRASGMFASGMLIHWTCLAVFSLIFTFHSVSALECHCEGEGCPEHHVNNNNTCTAKTNAKCYSVIREQPHETTGEAIIIHAYGCLPEEENSILQCKGNLVPQHHYRYQILCCDNEDFCNQELQPQLFPRTTTTPSYDPLPHSSIDWRYIGPFGLIVLLALFGVFMFCCVRRCRKTSLKKAHLLENQALMLSLPGSSDVEKGMEHTMTSGSGRGNPRLVQQTVYKQLKYLDIVGKGRYGEVVKAELRGDEVAVKIFSTLDEASWEWERDLYQTCMLRHENILGFVAADIGGMGALTQLILVMEYQKCSLYDHLRSLTEPVSVHQLFKMAHSIACGLSHLHADIVGTSSKPVIAHRDIKTKNILVKHDGVTCVLADLGLAVRKDRSNEAMLDTDKRQGTRRYMAPEILDFTIRKHDFDSFLMADMYSFSLVLWEMTRCIDQSGIGKDYRLPYQDEAGDDPDFDTMQALVCDDKHRPLIPDYWRIEESLVSMTKLIEECWNCNPSVRLSALNVKKKLAKNTPKI